jgi:hypothetical protein
MKPTAWMGAGLLALPLHLAWANPERPAAEPAGPHEPMPSASATDADTPGADLRTPSAAPAPTRLRDSLRQSADAGGEPFQPYRLSLEERQRLREQLRHHGTIEFRVKP